MLLFELMRREENTNTKLLICRTAEVEFIVPKITTQTCNVALNRLTEPLKYFVPTKYSENFPLNLQNEE